MGTIKKFILIILLNLCVSNSCFAEEYFKAPDMDFSAVIPQGFLKVPASETPPYSYALYKTRSNAFGDYLTLSFEGLGGLIQNNPVSEKELKKTFDKFPSKKLKLISIQRFKWKKYEVDIIESEKTAPDGQKIIILTAQIPSTPTATQIIIVGALKFRDMALDDLKNIINSVQCDTNWSQTPVASSAGIDKIRERMLAWGVAFFIVGLIIIWAVSKASSSKHLIFIIGLIIWYVGLQMGWSNPTPTRVESMIIGSMRLFGFCTVLLGAIDYSKKKRKEKAQETNQ